MLPAHLGTLALVHGLLAWPRVVALRAAAAAIGAGLYQAPDTFRRLDGQRAANARLTRTERALLPARGYDIATELFTRANELLPRDASYFFVSGPGIQVR